MRFGNRREQLRQLVLLARLNLDVFAQQLGRVLDESPHRRLLGFEAQPGLPLAGSAHAEVGNVASSRSSHSREGFPAKIGGYNV